MNMTKLSWIVLAAVIVANLAACQPSGPPPDIIKTQREDLQKAKAVGAVEQKSADEQKKAVEDATK